MSYALDIPVAGSPPYPLVVFGHDSGPETKNDRKDWAQRLVDNEVAVFRFDKRVSAILEVSTSEAQWTSICFRATS